MLTQSPTSLVWSPGGLVNDTGLLTFQVKLVWACRCRRWPIRLRCRGCWQCASSDRAADCAVAGADLQTWGQPNGAVNQGAARIGPGCGHVDPIPFVVRLVVRRGDSHQTVDRPGKALRGRVIALSRIAILGNDSDGIRAVGRSARAIVPLMTPTAVLP